MMRMLTCRCGAPLRVGQRKCTPCRKKHAARVRADRRERKQFIADAIVTGLLSEAA